MAAGLYEVVNFPLGNQVKPSCTEPYLATQGFDWVGISSPASRGFIMEKQKTRTKEMAGTKAERRGTAYTFKTTAHQTYESRRPATEKLPSASKEHIGHRTGEEYRKSIQATTATEIAAEVEDASEVKDAAAKTTTGDSFRSQPIEISPESLFESKLFLDVH
ncbi:hypothetical protein JTB14_014224 [Gonioctena quinquepunctata]|nr:hypothetical protein JTB14_014224 [Gonioctena quinquepunctata]